MDKDQNENLVIKKLRKTISEEKENTTRKTYGSDDGSPCGTSADDDIAPESSETIPQITLPKHNKTQHAQTDRRARAHNPETNKTHTCKRDASCSSALCYAVLFFFFFFFFFLLKIN